MKILIRGWLIAAALFLVVGCASMESRSQKLTLGMSRTSVIELMGSDYSIVAARVEPDGTSVSVLKYELNKKQPLFLYFRQDKLVQWGDTSVLSAMPDAAKPQ